MAYAISPNGYVRHCGAPPRVHVVEGSQYAIPKETHTSEAASSSSRAPPAAQPPVIARGQAAASWEQGLIDAKARQPKPAPPTQPKRVALEAWPPAAGMKAPELWPPLGRLTTRPQVEAWEAVEGSQPPWGSYYRGSPERGAPSDDSQGSAIYVS